MALKYKGYALVDINTTDIKTTIHPVDGGTIYKVFTNKKEAIEAAKYHQYNPRKGINPDAMRYDVLPIWLEFKTK